MSPFWQAISIWAATAHLNLYVLTALIAIFWAVSEVIVGSPRRPAEALGTWGAWMLLFLNALFACVVLALVLSLVPESTSLWLALAVGLGWQAMLRGGINLQPLPLSAEAGAQGSLGVPLNELYTRLQTFCVNQIRQQMFGRRISFLEHSVEELDLPELARAARLTMAAAGKSPAETEAYIQRLLTTNTIPEETKEIMFILMVVDEGGEPTLRRHIRRKQRHSRQVEEGGEG